MRKPLARWFHVYCVFAWLASFVIALRINKLLRLELIYVFKASGILLSVELGASLTQIWIQMNIHSKRSEGSYPSCFSKPHTTLTASPRIRDNINHFELPTGNIDSDMQSIAAYVSYLGSPLRCIQLTSIHPLLFVLSFSDPCPCFSALSHTILNGSWSLAALAQTCIQ